MEVKNETRAHSNQCTGLGFVVGPGGGNDPSQGGAVVVGERSEAEGEVGAAAALGDVIPIQGRLTDADGNPLDGSYSIRAIICDVSGDTDCPDVRIRIWMYP